MGSVNLCYNCFRERENIEGSCEHCGYDPQWGRETYPMALPHGYVLNGKYIVGRVLGQGGYGITYLAQDAFLKTKVAIKEYFPEVEALRDDATHQVKIHSVQKEESYEFGKNAFVKEAQMLAALGGDANLVRIYNFFEENNTAYFVMDYVEGISFQKYIMNHGGKLGWEEAYKIFSSVADTLEMVHKKGVIHRDVSADNIILASDGTIKLLDFGAAKMQMSSQNHSLEVVIKHGYAPIEQYSKNGKLGAYTDVYALCACFYGAVTGELPPDAPDRTGGATLKYFSDYGVEIPEKIETVIRKGLEVRSEDRYQTISELKESLKINEKVIEEQSQSKLPVRNKNLFVIATAVAVVAVIIAAVFAMKGRNVKEQQIAVNDMEFMKEIDVTAQEIVIAEIQTPEVINTMMEGDVSEFVFGSDYRKEDITEIQFVDSLADMQENSWDVSEAQDKSVMAWIEDGVLTIAADGKIGAPEDSTNLFVNYENVENICMNNLDTSNVKNMNDMFRNCPSIEELDVSEFDTSQVESMAQMFAWCESIKELDVSGFDTSKVTDMSRMFAGCESITKLDVSNFNTLEVTDMGGMFMWCENIVEVDVSGFDTSNVTDMYSMFGGCSRLQEVDVSGFDTSQVEIMGTMFEGCSSLSEINVAEFDTSKVTDMCFMFKGCSGLQELDVSGFETSQVEYMQSMFKGCSSLNEVDISKWNTSLADTEGMFDDCPNLVVRY